MHICGRWDLPAAAQAATEQANWPDSCRHNLAFAYHFDGMNLNKDAIRRAIRAGLKGWSDVAKISFRILKDFTVQAHIWATDGPLPGGVIAWSGLATGSCGARIEQRYDTLPTWTERLLQQVVTHEVGHALGLGHQPQDADSIMHPTVGRALVPNATDITALRRAGYDTAGRGAVIDELDGPPPPPPPDPPAQSIVVEGDLTLVVNGQPVKEFIVIPKPRV